MEQYSPESQTQNMITVGIDLQEGFQDDLVVICVNDRDVFRQEKVSTKLLLGYAETFQIQVPQGKSSISIQLPHKHEKKVIDLDIQQSSYIAVTNSSDGLKYVISETPFFYL